MRIYSITHSFRCAADEPPRYTKQNIAIAPSNPSAWNYLRGILRETKTPFASVQDFVRLYAYPHDGDAKRDVVDLDNPAPGADAELPCVHAMEFLADRWETEANSEVKSAPELARVSVEKSVEVR